MVSSALLYQAEDKYMTFVKLRVSDISKLQNRLSFGFGLNMQVILDIDGLTESAWSSCTDLAWLETWYHP